MNLALTVCPVQQRAHCGPQTVNLLQLSHVEPEFPDAAVRYGEINCVHPMVEDAHWDKKTGSQGKQLDFLSSAQTH